jgi:hypothetical protein
MAEVAVLSDTSVNLLVSTAPSTDVANAPIASVLPKGWASEYSAKYKRYFFIDESQTPPVLTWDGEFTFGGLTL